MATRPRIKIRHTPVTTYSPAASQGNYVGAQDTAGRRGTLPTFNDTNSYFISKTGADANAGTSASPKLTLDSLWTTTLALTTDNSGNAYNLTAAGSFNRYIDKYHRPIPPQGNYAAGPFTDSYYLTAPAGLRTALGGLTTFTIEFWVFADSLANNPVFIAWNDGASNNYVSVLSTGVIRFALNGTLLDSPASTITVGKWHYVKAYFSSGATNGKRIYCGSSPETAAIVAQATQTRTMGAVSSLVIGRADAGAGNALTGYLDRLYIANTANATLPIAPGTSGLLACYEFETRPLMQTAPKSYIVIKDSETYEEGLEANFPHEAIPAYGIYAADGETPVFKIRRGAKPGTYGAGNPAYSPYSSSCHYRISKSGNDGTGSRDAGGTGAGNPFLTIQAALNDAGRASGDVFRIDDSGEYTESLTLGSSNLTIVAKAGEAPILKPDPTSTNYAHLKTSSAIDVVLSGLYFQGNEVVGLYEMAGTPTAGDPGGNSFKAYDCTFINYNTNTSTSPGSAMVGSLSKYVDTTYQSCYMYNVAGMDFNLANTTWVNTWVNSSIDLSQPQVTWCTFTAKSVAKPTTVTMRLTNNYAGPVKFKSMLFKWCVFEPLSKLQINTNETTAADALAQFSVIGCDFKTGYPGLAAANNRALTISGFVAGSVNHLLVKDCYFDGQGACTDAIYLTEADAYYPMLRENVVVNLSQASGAAIYLAGAGLTNGLVEGLTAVNVYYALNMGSGVTAQRLAFKTVDATGYTGGVAPTYTNLNSSTDFVSGTLGAENAALVPSGAGIYAGNLAGTLDAGMDSAAFQVVTQGLVTIDGLTFEAEQNRVGMVAAPYADRSFALAFCTFNGSGTFGVHLGDTSTITKCLFAEPDGPAIRTQANLVEITHNVIYKGASGGIVNFGVSATIENNSVYRCLYGLYEFDGSVPLSLTDNILSASETYDYSGNNELAYSCVGTLDPDRTNTVDANSVRLDPLFRDPDNGDLRLQHLAVGSLFTSPAAGEGTGGADMGAFAFTYGTASTAWTTIDMGTSGYYNPDRLLRSSVAVRLSEDDQDNLAVRSASLGYRTQWQLTWEGGNPMSSAQTAALQAMFEASTNQVQIQFDGTNWVDGWLVKSNGFEYEEEPGYSDDSLPTPVKSVVIREA